MVAENDGGKRFTATFNTDVILIINEIKFIKFIESTAQEVK